MPVLRILDQGAKSKRGKKYWRNIRVGAEKKSIKSRTASGGEWGGLKLKALKLLHLLVGRDVVGANK